MGENDDLTSLSRRLEHSSQPIDFRRIHGLDRVVDHDESERALLESCPRQKQTQSEAVDLALAHHS